eukprot:Skav231449  [mRNA]  locus=scaffold1847:493235:495112:- [translate_table: standard]
MSSLLGALLTGIDTVGIRDGAPVNPRCHLMFTITDRLLTDDSILLKGTIHSPEGFGSGAFGQINVMVPPDREFLMDQEIEWTTTRPLPPLNTRMWFFDLEDADLCVGVPQRLRMGYRFDDQSNWVKVPANSPDDARIRCLELFAGGFGGWGAACDVLADFNGQQFTTIAVEKNDEIAKTYALSREAVYIPSDANLTRFTFDEGKCVINRSVEDVDLLRTMIEFAPHVVTVSAPCPPWSTAATSPGLGSGEGLLLRIRPTLVLLEQVPGFCQHQHFGVIMDLLKLLGYDLVWRKVVDLSQQAQPARARWLGLAVRVQSSLHLCPFQMWRNHDEWKPCRMHLPQDHILELTPSNAALQVAGDFRFVKNPVRNMDRSHEAVLATRIYQDDQPLPTFMARYGTQHQFAEGYLQEKGYFGFFKAAADTHEGCRFFSPAEIAAIHGVWSKTFIPFTLQDAWLVYGNQIAIPHSLLLVTNACRFLGRDLEVKDVFAFYHANKLNVTEAGLTPMPGGYMLAHRDFQLPQNQADAAAEIWGHRTLQPTEFWTFNHGICDVTPMNARGQATQISEASASEGSQAEEVVPVLKGHVHFGSMHQGIILVLHRFECVGIGRCLVTPIVTPIRGKLRAK